MEIQLLFAKNKDFLITTNTVVDREKLNYDLPVFQLMSCEKEQNLRNEVKNMEKNFEQIEQYKLDEKKGAREFS